eukprot:scaffold1220_cov259-Pinguiococcus_pyrenoidosus.AAC.4
MAAREARHLGRMSPFPEAKITYHHRNAHRVYRLLVEREETSGRETFDLVLKKDAEANVKRTVAPYEDWFDLIREEHDRSGHKGVAKVFAAVSAKYARVARDAVAIYTALCPVCAVQRERKGPRGAVLLQKSNYCNERWQLDVLHMQQEPEGQYKWLCHVQDQQSKFTLLRPLASNSAEDVASALFDAVADFALPTILQMDHTSAQGPSVEAVLAAFGKLATERGLRGTKIIRGRPRKEAVQKAIAASTERVRALLRSWQERTNSKKWSLGSRVVQLLLNTTADASGVAPMDLFCRGGVSRRNGVYGLGITPDVLAGTHTEDDLERLVANRAVEVEVEVEVEDPSSSPGPVQDGVWMSVESIPQGSLASITPVDLPSIPAVPDGLQIPAANAAQTALQSSVPQDILMSVGDENLVDARNKRRSNSQDAVVAAEAPDGETETAKVSAPQLLRS